METNVRYAIEIFDRWSEPYKRFENTTRGLSKKVSASYNDINKNISQLRTNIERFKKASDLSLRTDHVRKYKVLIQETEKKIRDIENATKTCTEKTNKWGSALQKVVPFLAAYKIFQTGFSFLKDSVMASAQVEKYAVTLKTMLGSTGAARERMAEYSDIAKSTPFELNEVVEAGNKLQAVGKYSRENLTMLGDLAAASGKPIDQVMNAYSKLASGQKGEAVMMFRDLLISNQDWEKAAGKNFDALKTDEMLSILPKIMQAKGFFGMMEQQAKTTEGRISNLKDAMFQLKVATGERMKPAFDSFLKGATNTVEKLREWVEIPTTQKIASEKVALQSLIGSITDANITQERRIELLNQLKTEYPEFLDGLDAETVKNQELLVKLQEVNQQYEKKMRLAVQKDFKTEEEKNLQSLYADEARFLAFLQAEDEAKKRLGVINQKYGGYIVPDKHESDYGIAAVDYNKRLKQTFDKAQESFSLNPNDKVAQGFIDDYLQYLAWEDLRKNSMSAMQDKSEAQKKLKSTQTSIRIQENRVKIIDKNISNEQRNDLYAQAKAVDLNDKAVVKKMFATPILKNEFASLISRDKTTYADSDWGRLNELMSGSTSFPKLGTGDGSFEQAQENIISGGKNVKNTNITIGKLVETISVTSETMEQGAEDFAARVKEFLLNAVNDANYQMG